MRTPENTAHGSAVWNAILASVALLIGGMTYVLWRSESLLMFSWFAALGAARVVKMLRGNADAYCESFPGWVIFSLPQALWLFSGIIYFHCIWRKDSAFGYRLWAGVLIAIAVGFEGGQLLNLVPGRFDVYDALSLVAACLSAWAVLRFTSRWKRRALARRKELCCGM